MGVNQYSADVLSLKEYKEGEAWKGHKQFCENFLNPLILKSKKGENLIIGTKEIWKGLRQVN